MTKREIREEEKRDLEKAAKKNPETRMKVERIESLEASSKSYKKTVIINCICAGCWALCTLLKLPGAIETSFEIAENVSFYLNGLCAFLWTLTAKANHNVKKEYDTEAKQLKREVLGYNK